MQSAPLSIGPCVHRSFLIPCAHVLSPQNVILPSTRSVPCPSVIPTECKPPFFPLSPMSGRMEICLLSFRSVHGQPPNCGRQWALDVWIRAALPSKAGQQITVIPTDCIPPFYSLSPMSKCHSYRVQSSFSLQSHFQMSSHRVYKPSFQVTVKKAIDWSFSETITHYCFSFEQ